MQIQDMPIHYNYFGNGDVILKVKIMTDNESIKKGMIVSILHEIGIDCYRVRVGGSTYGSDGVYSTVKKSSCEILKK